MEVAAKAAREEELERELEKVQGGRKKKSKKTRKHIKKKSARSSKKRGGGLTDQQRKNLETLKEVFGEMKTSSGFFRSSGIPCTGPNDTKHPHYMINDCQERKVIHYLLNNQEDKAEEHLKKIVFPSVVKDGVLSTNPPEKKYENMKDYLTKLDKRIQRMTDFKNSEKGNLWKNMNLLNKQEYMDNSNNFIKQSGRKRVDKIDPAIEIINIEIDKYLKKIKKTSESPSTTSTSGSPSTTSTSGSQSTTSTNVRAPVITVRSDPRADEL